MKETPILFSTPMVQAILNGTKTQTRRVLKPQPLQHPTDADTINLMGLGNENSPYAYTSVDLYDKKATHGCPYGVIGNLLYVRETFAEFAGIEPKIEYVYKADKTFDTPAKEHLCGNKWKPSLFMPKAAARLWLQITGIRVERLQTITEADAKAEGAQLGTAYYKADPTQGYSSHQVGFIDLWCKINGLESWQANPWVWVIEFEVISKTGKP